MKRLFRTVFLLDVPWSTFTDRQKMCITRNVIKPYIFCFVLFFAGKLLGGSPAPFSFMLPYGLAFIAIFGVLLRMLLLSHHRVARNKTISTLLQTEIEVIGRLVLIPAAVWMWIDLS